VHSSHQLQLLNGMHDLSNAKLAIKADVWSLGMLAIDLSQGSTPFAGMTPPQVTASSTAPILFTSSVDCRVPAT
jgi:hypothetical protein